MLNSFLNLVQKFMDKFKIYIMAGIVQVHHGQTNMRDFVEQIENELWKKDMVLILLEYS